MLSVFNSIPVELYIGLIVLAAGGAVVVVLGYLDERQTARESLRRLDGFQLGNQREQQLLAPLHQRLLSPVLASFARLGSRFNPPEYVEGIRLKHLQAGIHSSDQVERFLAVRILCFVLVPFWIGFVLLLNPLRLYGISQLVMVVIGVVALVVVPNSRLDSKVKERTDAIRTALPDVLDLMVISVEAGLGFEQAVDRVIANVPGELSEELARFMGETAAGSSRSDALRALQSRVDIPEIRSFVLAMIQADRFGVSIGQILRAQADEMRIRKRQSAQERAQKAPVKMLLPMVFCIFPALFVVILGPALINIRDSLG